MRQLLLSLLVAPWLLHAQSPSVGMSFYDDGLRVAQLLNEGNVHASLCIRPVRWESISQAKTPFASEDLFGRVERVGVALIDSTKGPWILSTLIMADSTTPDWIRTSVFKNSEVASSIYDPNQILLPNVPAHYRSPKGTWGLSVLPVEIKVRYNTHHPYGWQDGPMIPNVGLQVYQSFGVYAKAGPLEFQFRPEKVNAENRDFINPPIRRDYIDMPDRFGTDPYGYTGMGQSFVKYNTRYVGVGLSTENLWWGPGRYSSLLMSNNAPGFYHVSIHSNKPIHTPLGDFEFQTVGAQLDFSGFYPYPTKSTGWPPVAPDIVPNLTYDGESKNFTGLAVNYQPKWFPGLYLGANRAILYQADSVSLRDMLALVAPVLKNVTGEDGGARNQIVTAYFRYLFQDSNAEIYAEFGREDAAWDFEDLMSDLEHTRAYLLGFRKFTRLAKEGHWVGLDFEMTEIAQGTSSMSRSPGYSWYQHGPFTNPTHMGQVLGAGAGPGSSIQTGGITYRTKKRQISFHMERYEHDKEAYYYHIDYLQLRPGQIYPDISKRWVDLSGIIGYRQMVFGWQMEARLQIMQTWNFNWRYDPNETGGRFRHPGLNALSPQFYLNAVYRL